MRNAGSKDKRGRYMSTDQLQKKLRRVSLELDHFANQLYRRSPMSNLIDFDKLHALREHFMEVGKLNIEK